MQIAISGINATDNPGPGIPVAKSLNESDLDCRCIGLSYDANDPGNYLQSMLAKSYILPYPSKGWNRIHKQLRNIRNNGGLDFVIPCLDAELPLFIRHQESLAADAVTTFLPTAAQFELRNKRNLCEFSKEIGLKHPETICVYSIDELYDALHELGYPVVIKGQYYKANAARTLADACKHFTEISAEWGLPILVQRMVEGEEINLVGVGDGEGGDLGMVAIKKLTTTSLGKIWSGVTIQNEGMIEAARRFLEVSKWRGPFELECIASGDDIHLIEINPRFPAWVYFATGVGINLPERLVRHALGLDTPTHSDYPAGKLFVRYTDEIVCDMKQFSDLITTGESHECPVLQTV